MKRAKLSLSAFTTTANLDPAAVELVPGAQPQRHRQASREGTKLIGGHFPQAMWKELATLALRLDRTHQDLLGEALTDLFDKYRAERRSNK